MFTARDVIRRFVGRHLEGLSVTERDDVVEVLTACQAEGQDLLRTAHRLEPILLELRFTWPARNHWRRQFKDTAAPAWLPVFDPRGGPEMRREEILLIAESALGSRLTGRECPRASRLR